MFADALQGGRGDIGSVLRYLQLPVHRRPALSPYFDAAFYFVRNPGLLEAGTDPFLHFLTEGLSAHRSPHPLIDLPFLRLRRGGEADAPMSVGALLELLESGEEAPSPYFDPSHYRSQLGDAARATAGLRHFLHEGLPAGCTPNPWFDPRWYAERYSDVPQDPLGSVRHFVLVGDPEARCAGPRFDGTLYRRRYVDVADAKIPPLWHFIVFGRGEARQAPLERAPRGRPNAAQPIITGIGEPLPCDADSILRADAAIRLRLAEARQARKDAIQPMPQLWFAPEDTAAAIGALRMPGSRAPRVSVLIPAYNALQHTLGCLMSIAAAPPSTPCEVIVADDGSTDELAQRLKPVPHLRVLRQRRNAGFLANCNAAWPRCRGEYVLLLNNDAQLQPGAVDRLVAALDADPDIAAAGPRLLYPDGHLQEAGCAVRPDGGSVMAGLFEDPADPSYAYDRDVTYCSGAALMLRRAAVGERLFDPVFAPAYAEDVDLCLRLIAAGKRVRYVASAVAVHALGASSAGPDRAAHLRAVAMRQHIVAERWAELLHRLNAVRVLAFYLPQFHRTPQNDLSWGAGFTEWTNVAKAQPSYAGHYQPHLPADLGFYDLRVPETLRAQAELAASAGVEAFCVYYYNFSGRPVLSAPLEAVLRHPDIPFRFCLCWANENWTRKWDGGDGAVLQTQSYDDTTLRAVIADARRFAEDPRYVRVEGKPLLLVYRASDLPDPAGFAASCRSAFSAAGLGGVHLVFVEGMERGEHRPHPRDLGFDASVEFPPHGKAVPSETPVNILKPGWSGYRYDYEASVEAFCVRPGVPYERYPAVFPMWDNTPRQPMYGTSFDGASPEAFRAYVEAKLDEVRVMLHGDRRLLFVNAWNEWAEGAHLEPDHAFGHRWLEALRAALESRRWQ